MVPRMIDQLLCALHRNWTLPSQQRCNLQCSSYTFGLGVEHATDKPNAQRLVGTEDARGETHVFYPGGGADDFWEARQGPDVGCETDVDFFYGEAGRGRAETDVGAAGYVDCKAEGEAVEDTDYGCKVGALVLCSEWLCVAHREWTLYRY